MKENLLIIFLISLLSAGSIMFFKTTRANYTKETESQMRRMKEPIILLAKTKTTFHYSVDLQDATGKLYQWGNMSNLADFIGENYEVGDTIHKKDFIKEEIIKKPIYIIKNF